MAKNGMWIKLLMGVGIALLAFASGYGMLKNKVSQNKEELKQVKAEGCIPARENKTNIQLIQKDIEIIKDGQQRQNVKLDAILEKL